jgi:hypothetical protein
MLGVYENFPEGIQKIAFFTTSVSYKKLQQALTEILHRLNTETSRLEDLGNPSIPQCQIAFEFGIADTQTFNYLDDKEMKEVLNRISERAFSIMDFLCVLRYYRTKNEKQTPLRFDYYMFRLKFDKGMIEMRIFHERGSMHISPEEIANLVRDKVNAAFSRKVLKTTAPD